MLEQADNSLDLSGSLQQLLNQRCVSERAQASAPATSRTEQARSASASTLGDFLSRMCHEMRLPMSNMLSYADSLQDVVAHPEARESVAALLRCGDQLATLIEDISELAKIETGGFNIVLNDIDLRRLLSDLIVSIEPTISVRDVQIVTEVSSRVPDTIQLDTSRVRQIMHNLIGNALKFTELGEVRVAVDLATDNQGDWLRIGISDTGRGISEERIEELFEPFPELKDAPSCGRKYGGLGLAVNYRLAKLLGGRIEVESKLNRGSTFTLVLPLVQDSESVADSQARPMLPGGEASRPASAPLQSKLLLVDANQDSLRLLTMLLRSAGAEVVTAANGREGMELALSHRPERCRRAGDVPHHFDAVLVSMSVMPEMSGHELIAQLRELAFDKPLLAIVEEISCETQEECGQAGFAAVLARPLTRDMLIRELQRVLLVDSPI